MLVGACAALLALAAASGCRAGPDYAAPAVPAAEMWSQEVPPEIVLGPAIDEQWWHSFADPVLSELVERVRMQNFALQEAEARIAESRAQYCVARGGLWPEVWQIDSYTSRRFGENGTQFGPLPIGGSPFEFWQIGFDAAWEIDVAGKRKRTVEAADANVEAAVARRDDLLVRLIGEVARTYIELRTAQERVAVTTENVRLQQATVGLTEDRMRAGAAGPLDVAQAKSQLGQTEAVVPELRNQVKMAENRLCVLQGEPPRSLEAQLQGQRPIPQPPAQIEIGLPLELLRRRPDVRRVEREVAAQSAAIGIAAADLYPQLTLVGTFAPTASNLPAVFDWSSLYYSVGPSVRWSILNFGRVKCNVAAQQARWEQTVANYRQTVIEATEEVENALSGLIRERERERHLAAATASAREAVQIAQMQYREGAVGFQSLLDSQRVLLEVQDQHVAARGRVAAAAILLFKTLGGGWELHGIGMDSVALPSTLVAPLEILPPALEE
jgi:NodT family efflux transporter outer membrane factor (OMF) lipoprotein